MQPLLHSASLDPSAPSRVLLAYGRGGRASIARDALRLVPAARGRYALRVEPRKIGQKLAGGVLLGGLDDTQALELAELGVQLDGAKPRKPKVAKVEPVGDFDLTAETYVPSIDDRRRGRR